MTQNSLARTRMLATNTLVRALRPYQFRGKHRLLRSLGVPVDLQECVPSNVRDIAGFGGLTFISDNPRDIMFRAWYLDGHYQDDVWVALLNLVRPGSTFWDVGANQGSVSCFVDRFCGDNLTLHAFEPDTRNAAHLRRNLDVNTCTRVQIHPIGLADSAGPRTFTVSPDCSWASTLIPDFGEQMNGAYQTTITVETMDAIADRLGPPTVLKIDVEGAEHLVLQGGQRTLQMHRPSLVIECNKLSLRAAKIDPQAFLDELRSFGYTLLLLRKPLVGFHRWSQRTQITSANQLPDLSNLVALVTEPSGPERRLHATA